MAEGFGDIDRELTECDREPIAIPGAIQPHGAVLVCEPDGVICAASANCDGVVGMTAPALLGRFARAAGHELGDLVESLAGSASRRVAAPIRLRLPDRDATAMAHRNEPGQVVVECSRETPEPEELRALRERVESRVLGPIQTARTAEDGLEAAVHGLRRVLGCDRVMAYRFMTGWHGEVVAESAGERRFLNHRFPASDIPAQARAMYRRNVARLIPSASYEPVPLIPRDPRDPPVDLSGAWLRSVSPVHLQYLHNMGVEASLSISLIVQGTLWGLIVGHHGGTLSVPFQFRQSLELLGQVVSLKLEGMLREQQRRAHAEAAAVLRAAPVAALVQGRCEDDRHASEALERLQALVRSDGVALVGPGRYHTAGFTPPEPALRELVGRLVAGGLPVPLRLTSAPDGIGWPDDPREAPPGVLAAPFDHAHTHSTRELWILWFRREQTEPVRWAGNPDKPLRPTAGGAISPRLSFETWVEQARGTCRDWSDADLAAAAACQSAAELRDTAAIRTSG